MTRSRQATRRYLFSFLSRHSLPVIPDLPPTLWRARIPLLQLLARSAPPAPPASFLAALHELSSGAHDAHGLAFHAPLCRPLRHVGNMPADRASRPLPHRHAHGSQPLLRISPRGSGGVGSLCTHTLGAVEGNRRRGRAEAGSRPAAFAPAPAQKHKIGGQILEMKYTENILTGQSPVRMGPVVKPFEVYLYFDIRLQNAVQVP